MITTNVGELKAHLSEYLKRVEAGETLVISRHNRPIAEIRPLVASIREPRPYGLDRGTFRVPDDFNDPLPDHIQALFEGR